MVLVWFSAADVKYKKSIEALALLNSVLQEAPYICDIVDLSAVWQDLK